MARTTTDRKTLEFKGDVIYLTTTSTGDYYVVPSTKRQPTMVKRTRYNTTVCLGCGLWEGVDRNGVERNGCVHTNVVEYAIERNVVKQSTSFQSLAAALSYVETDEAERGSIPE